MIDLKSIKDSGFEYSDWLIKEWPKSFNGESYAKINLIACLKEIEEELQFKEKDVSRLKNENQELKKNEKNLNIKIEDLEETNNSYKKVLFEKNLEIENLKNIISQSNLNSKDISNSEETLSENFEHVDYLSE